MEKQIFAGSTISIGQDGQRRPGGIFYMTPDTYFFLFIPTLPFFPFWSVLVPVLLSGRHAIKTNFFARGVTPKVQKRKITLFLDKTELNNARIKPKLGKKIT